MPSGGCPPSARLCRAGSVLLCLAAGLLAFEVLIGHRLLDPTSYGWLFTGDYGQHFIGWSAFLADDWRWPPGAIPRLDAPRGTSLVFTDALPLLALPLKAILGPGAEPLQFQGVWILAATLLQGLAALWCLRRMGAPEAVALPGALLLILWPPLYDRLIVTHDTLTAQWILLLAIGLLFARRAGWALAALAALMALALLVHAYLAAMVGLVLVGAAARAALEDRRALRRALLAAGPVAGLLAGLMWALGYFVVPLGGVGGAGLGHFSMDLTALWNPLRPETSRLLPPLPTGPGQYEGFAYLGAGGLLVLGAGLALAPWARPRHGPAALGLLLAALAAGLLAVSPVVSWRGEALLEVPLPATLEAALAPFRSSGRFAWLLGLALLLAALLGIARALPHRWAGGLVLAAVALQAYDLSEMPRAIRAATAPQPATEARLARLRAAWPDEADRLVFAMEHPVAHHLLYPLAFVAVTSGAATDLFYVARRDRAARKARWRALRAELLAGRIPVRAVVAAPRGEPVACRLATHAEARVSPALDAVLIAGGSMAEAPSPLAGWRIGPPETATATEALGACGAGCALALVLAGGEAPPAFAAALTERGAREIRHVAPGESYLAVLSESRVVGEARGRGRWAGAAGGLDLAAELGGPGPEIRLAGLACIARPAGQGGPRGVVWRRGPRAIRPLPRRF